VIIPRKTTFAILSVVVLLLLALTLGYLIGRSREMSITTTPEASELAQTPTSRSPLPKPPATAWEMTTPSPGPTESDDGSSNGLPYSQTDEAKRRWEPVVEGFGKSFTNSEGSDKTWLSRLEPFSTEDVRQSLATVDPGNVPDGLYGEYEILQHGDTELAAQVTYREGWSMVLYLINEGMAWRVFRYDRFKE
jgi:hypothetical protein